MNFIHPCIWHHRSKHMLSKNFLFHYFFILILFYTWASSTQLVSPNVAHPAELVHFYFDMHHSLTVVSSDCTNFFTGSRDSTYENIHQEGGNQHLFHSSKYSILVDAKIVYVSSSQALELPPLSCPDNQT